ISWRESSVRGFARDQSRTSFHRGLVTSLTRCKAKIQPLDGWGREVTKHVESFGVFSWIRVQFSAPPPIFEFRIWNLTLERDLKSAIRNSPSANDWRQIP